MSHMNMAGINAGSSALGGMSLINNGTNGATPRAESDQGDNSFEARLNTHIYDYFLKTENYDCARALLNSHVPMEPAIRRRDGEMNGTDDPMHTDSKDNIDSKRPEDLPGLSDNSNFLLEWYSTFWDFYLARTKHTRATPQALQYMQQQNRLRAEQQHHQMLRTPGMVPAGLDNYQQMMRFQQANGLPINGDLRQKALQNNNRNAFGQPNHQQIAQMKNHQMMQQQQMRRDPSDLDINGQRPRTPSSGDNNAPSPSKRPRLDGVPMNGPQMIPNGRGPPQGLQGQQLIDNPNFNANVMLMNSGIDPQRLSQHQVQAFQSQNPHVQEKSIQVYAQNMKNSQQRQSQSKPGIGSPMMHQGMEMPSADNFFGVNPQMQMRVGQPANGTGGNHALQDYQMQLMLLEQQNKKRLLMARQEQENTSRPEGQSGLPGGQGFAPGMSPSGSRSGPSPGPNDQMKRGTPKMGAANLPSGGSPMPDGTMSRPGGSPAAMTYANQMPPEMFQQLKMNESMGAGVPPNMRPPSSHPQFSSQQYNPQHMEAMRRSQAGQMPNGGWAQPPGQAPMMQQPPQTQQQPSIGTSQQRSMAPPPPNAPAGATTNGRPASPAQPAAPATPLQSAKPNPKARKDGKEPRKRPTKKTSNAGAGASSTPATDAENPPQTPAPSTPITAMNASSFSQPAKNEGQTQAGLMQGVPAASNTAPLALPQPDAGVIPQFTGLDAPDGDFAMPFTTELNGDVLENFDFDSFLQGTTGEEFNFDAASLGGAFGAPDGVEAGAGDT